MPANVFIVGLGETDRDLVASLPRSADVRVHGLLDPATLERDLPFDLLVEEAEQQLGRFDGSIDGIAGYRVFPTSCLVPILCRAFDRPGPLLESVVRCEHKYWSRLLQREVVPDHVPTFSVIDPFEERPRSGAIAPPFWLKGIHSHTQPGFRISSWRDLDRALEDIRRQAGRFEAFDEVLRRLDLPATIGRIHGGDYIVEELVPSERQCCVEGYMLEGEVVVLGIVDIQTEGGSVIRRQYPSTLPHDARAKAVEITKRVISHLGLEGGHFSTQLAWDASSGRIWLIEIDSHVSAANAGLFARVDGAANLGLVLDLALGRRPRLYRREGPFSCAVRFPIRSPIDARLHRVPSRRDLQTITDRFPGTDVELCVEEGMRLSEAPRHDGTGFELARVVIGAQDEASLLARTRAVKQMLPFELGTPA